MKHDVNSSCFLESNVFPVVAIIMIVKAHVEGAGRMIGVDPSYLTHFLDLATPQALPAAWDIACLTY